MVTFNKKTQFELYVQSAVTFISVGTLLTSCSGGGGSLGGSEVTVNTVTEESDDPSSDPEPSSSSSPSPSSSSTSGADTTAPQVSSISVTGNGQISIVFNESVSAGATTAANYTLSGAGMGNLSANPNSVSGSGSTYTLSWSSGVMLNSNNVTVTVASVQDVAGNAIGGTNHTATASTGSAVTTTTVASLSLDSGASSSTDLTVDVAFGSFGATVSEVCLRNDATVGSCSWVAVGSAPATHSISSGLGSKTVTAYVRDAAGNVGSASDAISLSCITGFVQVPGNATYVANDFCLAQYEMKAVLSSGPSVVADGGYSSALNMATHHAESRPDGQPWVRITHPQMVSECTNSTQRSGGFSLMSNDQWMTAARNIEQVAANWSGAAVGSGFIPRGHSDSTPYNGIAVTDTNDPFSETGNSSGSGPEESRRLAFSNGGTIWDLSGNVWEFVSGSHDTVNSTPSLNFFSWPALVNVEYTNATYFDSSHTVNRRNYAPLGNYSTTQGMGNFLGHNGTVLSRSGSFQWGTDNGIFRASTLESLDDTGFENNEVGFRCAYTP